MKKESKWVKPEKKQDVHSCAHKLDDLFFFIYLFDFAVVTTMSLFM